MTTQKRLGPARVFTRASTPLQVYDIAIPNGDHAIVAHAHLVGGLTLTVQGVLATRPGMPIWLGGPTGERSGPFSLELRTTNGRVAVVLTPDDEPREWEVEAFMLSTEAGEPTSADLAYVGLVCGAVERGAAVVRCECGALRQAGRPHGFEH